MLAFHAFRNRLLILLFPESALQRVRSGAGA